MSSIVGVVRYREPLKSVKRAVDLCRGLRQVNAGIDADPGLFVDIDQLPGFFMAGYQNRPEFEERFFRVA